MTTATDPRVRIEPNGYVTVCAWCLSSEELLILNRIYPGLVTHSLCESCERKLNGEPERGA